MDNCRFFAGGNTADGFVSFFPYVLPTAECNHMYYIKGGPGVGKSNMMKQIGLQMEEKGCYVEYFDCSGDPDSVDGITISAHNRSGENVKIGFIDATAPHSYDPVVPGARDTLVSLGDYLDESALEPYQDEIQGLVNRCSVIYRQSYAYLNATGSVLQAMRQYEWNAGEVRKFVNELFLQNEFHANLSLTTTSPKPVTIPIRHLFAEAYTHKGFISHLDTLPCQKIFLFDLPIGVSANPLLQAILEEMLAQHIEVIALHDPLQPSLLKHLYLPKQQALFKSLFSEDRFLESGISAEEGMRKKSSIFAEEGMRKKSSIFAEEEICKNLNISAEAGMFKESCISAEKVSVHVKHYATNHFIESGLLKSTAISLGEVFDGKVCEQLYKQLTECAIQHLRLAKTAHDELETYYVKNMDFSGWQMKLDSILHTLYNQIDK